MENDDKNDVKNLVKQAEEKENQRQQNLRALRSKLENARQKTALEGNNILQLQKKKEELIGLIAERKRFNELNKMLDENETVIETIELYSNITIQNCELVEILNKDEIEIQKIMDEKLESVRVSYEKIVAWKAEDVKKLNEKQTNLSVELECLRRARTEDIATNEITLTDELEEISLVDESKSEDYLAAFPRIKKQRDEIRAVKKELAEVKAAVQLKKKSNAQLEREINEMDENFQRELHDYKSYTNEMVVALEQQIERQKTALESVRDEVRLLEETTVTSENLQIENQTLSEDVNRLRQQITDGSENLAKLRATLKEKQNTKENEKELRGSQESVLSTQSGVDWMSPDAEARKFATPLNKPIVNSEPPKIKTAVKKIVPPPPAPKLPSPADSIMSTAESERSCMGVETYMKRYAAKVLQTNEERSTFMQRFENEVCSTPKKSFTDAVSKQLEKKVVELPKKVVEPPKKSPVFQKRVKEEKHDLFDLTENDDMFDNNCDNSSEEEENAKVAAGKKFFKTPKTPSFFASKPWANSGGKKSGGSIMNKKSFKK